MLTLAAAWPPSLLDAENVGIIGATYDIEAINGIEWLMQNKGLKKGDTIGDLDVSEEVRRAALRLGIQRLHPEQKRVLDEVLAGHDVLMVLPTGFGKSACYQIPSMILPKPVLVISPLLALMRDQSEKLAALDVPCVRLDGTVRGRERAAAIARVAAGPGEPGWSDVDEALVRSVDEALETGKVADDTWAVLAREFSEQQLMDLVFTTGCYAMLAIAMRSLEIELEPGLPASLPRGW